MRDRHPEIPCISHMEVMEYADGITTQFDGRERFKDVAELEKGILRHVARLKLAGVNMRAVPEIVTKELVSNLKAKG